MPLIDDGDQDLAGVGEQGPAIAAFGLTARAAALLEEALFGPGCLRRAQARGQLIQLAAAHPGQPGIRQRMQDL